MSHIKTKAFFSILHIFFLMSAASAERVVAIGDVHGDYANLVARLEQSQLIDAEGAWIGGTALLVQVGDFLDKGADVRSVLDLLMRLQKEAAKQGGRVEVLLGNHEAMNLVSATRDVHPGVYASFRDASSEKRRENALKDLIRFHRFRASLWGLEPPKISSKAKEKWYARHPLGQLEYLEAVGPDGTYGRWLRTLPAAIRVGNTVFVHAGPNPETNALTVQQINQTVKHDIQKYDCLRKALIKDHVVLPFFDYSEITSILERDVEIDAQLSELRKQGHSRKKRKLTQEVRDFLAFDGGVLLDPDGPLWFRGFAYWTPDEAEHHLEKLMNAEGNAHYVCGHTPQVGGIKVRFDNRVVLIDTGNHSGGAQTGGFSSLEISDATFWVLDENRKEFLFKDAATPEIAVASHSQAPNPF